MPRAGIINSPSSRAETCCFSTLPLPGSQVCSPSLYLGVRCVHPPFTWESGVFTLPLPGSQVCSPSLYLGVRCVHPPFTWESGVFTLPLPGSQVLANQQRSLFS
ncbi:hypothetical protein COCON_G00126470 [Conger conger]|uniref:Uncharacterized protein n=1 Tax=Conger conger TaxID=82655 RepID=A0A9Q1HW70_CONCO|nr:hypothetical protein COCON_G00126470 [Conger conger]